MSYVPLRVARRIVNLAAVTDGTSRFYDVNLTLNLKGYPLISDGGTADFPYQPPGSCLINHYAVRGVGSSISWPFTPTAGNVLVLLMMVRGGYEDPVTGWTTIAAHDGRTIAYQRVSDGTETSMSTHMSGGDTWDIGVFEIAGDDSTTVSAYGRISGGLTNHMVQAITPPTGGAMILAQLGENQTDNLYVLSADAGWTEVLTTGTGNHPSSVVMYQELTAASGSYTAGATIARVGDGAGVDPYDTMAVAISTANCALASPPRPGQWVRGEQVTITGTTGTTRFPYMPGSLFVRVDGISLSSFFETDPTTGVFDLTWEPPLGSQAWVDYQSR